MKNDHNLNAIFKHFKIDGTFESAEPFGSGHINDTFLVHARSSSGTRRYIFQRINHLVFPDPAAVMENISRVTRHIRRKLESLELTENEIARRVLTVIPCIDGNGFYRDEGGNYWRVYLYITGARTIDVLYSNGEAYRPAYKYGEFLRMLSDLPGPTLHEIIPGFHDGQRRFKAFQDALTADVFNRAGSAKNEIDFLLCLEARFDVLPRLEGEGRLPVRITHNDTKINNVMLDEKTGEGLCVIDLDTVMPGLSLYDFGDLVRTSLSTAAEDERDLTKITLDVSRFEVLVKGFLDGAGGMLTAVEKEQLVFSAQLMTLIIGTRFLTDYLQGDSYFKIHRPGQNLDRCRMQFQVVKLIIEKSEKMEAVIKECLRRPSGSPTQGAPNLT